MSGGWLGGSYLSTGWVNNGWLWSQPYTPGTGAWNGRGYLSRNWVTDTWLHYVVSVTGAAVSQQNAPGLALVALAGSAKQRVIINATQPTLALAALPAVANAGHRAVQANVPGISLASFPVTVNGGVDQVADVTFKINVASIIHYTDAVVGQNVPGLALTSIDAIVTLGGEVNVAVTLGTLPLVAFSTSVKANTSTRAVAMVALPLVAYDASIAVGLNVAVGNVPALDLAPIDAAVELAARQVRIENVPHVALSALAATVSALRAGPTVINIRAAGSVRNIRARATIGGVRASARR